MKKTPAILILTSYLMGCATYLPNETGWHEPAWQEEANSQPPVVIYDRKPAQERSGPEQALNPRNRSQAELSLYAQAKQQASNQQHDQAAATIERALRINPHAAEGYLQLAQLRWKTGDDAAALQMAKKALFHAPNHYMTNTNEFRMSVWQLILAIHTANNNATGTQEAEQQLNRLKKSVGFG